MTRRPSRAGSPSRNVTIRASDEERVRWEAAAICVDMRISDWVRLGLDGAAARLQMAMLGQYSAALKQARRKMNRSRR